MIKFRLFGYPITIQWMFWLLCVILGAQGATSGREGIFNLLIWVAVLFTAVLLHELGHAWARKRYGAPHSEIVLHGFGGYCTGPGHFTRNQNMFISFAGPLMNFVLAGSVFLLANFVLGQQVGTNQILERLAWTALNVNIFLGVLNLFPIYPLDGGQIFAAFMADKKPSVVPIVGMVLAAALAIFGLMTGSIFMALIFGMLAFQNWQRSQGQTPGQLF